MSNLVNSAETRSCVVVLSISNLTGFLNNAEEGKKLRIDYSALLEKAANGRNVIGAICVSQQDPFIMGAKSEESRKKNRKFLYSLQAFSWTPLEVEYNSGTRDITPVVSRVYDSVCDLLLDPEGNPMYDLATTDLVFITGSAQWSSVIDPFVKNGLSVEVLYPKKSTSSILYGQFMFRDLYPFILESNDNVVSKSQMAWAAQS